MLLDEKLWSGSNSSASSRPRLAGSHVVDCFQQLHPRRISSFPKKSQRLSAYKYTPDIAF